MCVRIKCDRCGKPSWAGCGAHVEQVLRDVPADERCRCAADASKPDDKKRSLLDRLLSR